MDCASPPGEYQAATAIVVCYQSERHIRGCLSALLNSTYPIAQLVVVDNASEDDSAGTVETFFPTVQIVRSERNLGFAGGVNLGLAQAKGEFVAIVNPDVVVRPDWLAEMVKVMEADPDIGIAGCKLLFGDGRTIQHAGGILHYPLALADHYGYQELDLGRYDRAREVDYVTGAAIVARRKVLEQVGGLDEAFYPAYFEETDLCWRIRKAGFKVMYVPTAVGIHYESASTVRDSFNYYYFYHRNRLRFVLKHYTSDQFLNDFLPAELQRLESIGPVEEKRALTKVYREAVEEAFSGDSSTAGSLDTDAMRKGIAQLSRKSSQLFGYYSEGENTHGQQGTTLTPTLSLEGRGGQMISTARLREMSQVSERPFVSDAGLLGPMIARFRTAWNWVSTKWYVLQMFEQQNRFNAVLLDYVAASEKHVADVEEKLTRMIGEVEQTAISEDRTVVEATRRLAELSNEIRRIKRQ